MLNTKPSMRRSLFGIGIALLLSALVVAGVRAALLSFVDSYVNGSDGITDMQGPFAGVLSPDGEYLYALSDTDSSIVVFSRDTSSGALTFVESHVNGEASPAPATATLKINGVTGLAISPDGNFIYAVADGSDNLNVFSRDSSTGVLTHKYEYTSASYLTNPQSVQVSEDGKYVFVGASGNVMVSAWKRQTNTGAISFLDNVATGASPPNFLAVSPDGTSIYAGDGSTHLYLLSWDGTNLTYVTVYSDGVDSTKMNGTRQVRVTSDGKNVIILGTFDDSVVVFTRNTGDGTLTLLQEITDNSGSVNYLDFPENIAISPSGDYVYVGSDNEDAVTVFSRGSDGSLTYQEEAVNGSGGVTNMTNPKGLGVVSPDNCSLYVSGYDDEAIVQFDTGVCGSSSSASTVTGGSVVNKDIASSGTTTLQSGRIWVSVPSNAIPDGESNCRISITDKGDSGEYGFRLDDTVWDVSIVCSGAEQRVLYAPISVCIRPKDGVTTDKQVFHKHGGADFTALASTGEKSGYVCGQTQTLSLFTLGSVAVPNTGFEPGMVTLLPEQSANAAYVASDLTLDIPTLDLHMDIVGVPQGPNGWDVSWLGNDAGYLYGTAFPTMAGNTVLTAHVWNADNTPGPFAELDQLQYGDHFTINAWGQTYTYEVRSSSLYSPNSLSPLRHEDYDWVTLITCHDYNETTSSYSLRRVVRAVLVSVD